MNERPPAIFSVFQCNFESIAVPRKVYSVYRHRLFIFTDVRAFYWLKADIDAPETLDGGFNLNENNENAEHAMTIDVRII